MSRKLPGQRLSIDSDSGTVIGAQLAPI